MRVRTAWYAAILFSLAASAAHAKESVSAEEWAFRYQRLAGAIQATGSLVDLFLPEDPYCPYPMRPSKKDDLDMLDGWNERLRQLDLDVVNLQNGIADADEGLRDEETFTGLTGVTPEQATFDKLRRQIRDIQRKIPPKKAEVTAAREEPCVRSHEPQAPPPAKPPPPPPPDPNAGLAPPELLPFDPPVIPDPLCTEEQRQAALRAVGEQRYNADENAVRVSHFRHDISLAIVDGRGDPAALRAMHDQADQDLKHWDAKSAEMAALWSALRKQPLDDCEQQDETASVPAPKYNFGLGASYLYQRLPANSGQLGVIDVGGAEQELLRNPRELDGFTVDLWNSVWNVGPRIGGSAATLFLAGSYGQADGERSNSIGSDPGIVNGITWWMERNGSSGISAPGSNLAGNVELDYETFEIRGGFKWDFPCGDDEDYDDEEGPWRYPRVRFALPTTIVETGIGVNYNEQGVRQQFFMGNPNPGFELFDVRTRNQIESTDWSFLGNFGVHEVLPIPGIEGMLLTAGGEVGIGYYRTRADADQWNSCDIRFAALPGVNQCANPGFGVSVNPDHSGFDYRVGASVRLSQSLDFIHPGVHVGASYQFDYLGISQLDTPVNFTLDGPPDLDWSHQPRHRVGLFAGMFF